MDWLTPLLQNKIVRPIDAEFCRFMVEHEYQHSGNATTADEGFGLLCLLVSVALGQQHSCLELNQLEVNDPLGLGQLHHQYGLPDISLSLSDLTDYHCVSRGHAEL